MRSSWLLLAACAACAACGAAQTPHRPTVGSIAGLVRDHDSGTVIAQAGIHVRAPGDMTRHDGRSNGDGHYLIDHLQPGRYSLEAEFAGQPIDVEDIAVRAGNATFVDLTFTLGRPDPIRVDFGNAREGAIDHYKPPALGASAVRIEGTVNEVGTRDRVAGAVVMASGTTGSTLEAVSDDQGRYQFDDLPPGVYTISAYYSIGGRGQIEVRRSEIHVPGGTAVVVPLWVEVAR